VAFTAVLFPVIWWTVSAALNQIGADWHATTRAVIAGAVPSTLLLIGAMYHGRPASIQARSRGRSAA
jgi:hypothetical protein